MFMSVHKGEGGCKNCAKSCSRSLWMPPKCIQNAWETFHQKFLWLNPGFVLNFFEKIGALLWFLKICGPLWVLFVGNKSASCCCSSSSSASFLKLTLYKSSPPWHNYYQFNFRNQTTQTMKLLVSLSLN